MNELHDSVDYNNWKFEYVGPTNNVSFYEYIDSKGLFNVIKNNQLKFDDALKRQEELLNKINEVKIGKKTLELKEVINYLAKCYKSREKGFNFFRDYTKIIFGSSYQEKQDKTEGQDLKY